MARLLTTPSNIFQQEEPCDDLHLSHPQVHHRRADTHDVASWQFVPQTGSLPAVLAGQCVTLHTEIDGKPHCRAYTLSSSPQDAYWQVTIKDVGLVSHHLHQTLQVGTRSEWMAPLATST